MGAYNGASNNELTIVQAGSVELHQDFVGTQIFGKWYREASPILEGLFEAILASEDPLTSHVLDE